MRHINVQSLWLQEKEAKEEATIKKIGGEDNAADDLAKHVRHELAEKYPKVIGLTLSKDRAEGSLRLAGE